MKDQEMTANAVTMTPYDRYDGHSQLTGARWERSIHQAAIIPLRPDHIGLVIQVVAEARLSRQFSYDLRNDDDFQTGLIRQGLVQPRDASCCRVRGQRHRGPKDVPTPRHPCAEPWVLDAGRGGQDLS
jgi:hypothetical protein